jgi:hypothetical protein
MHRSKIRRASILLCATLLAAACGGDDDATDTAASQAPAATTPQPDEHQTDEGTGDQALGSAAVGTVTMSVEGETVFSGEVTGCTLVEPDLQVTAQGETAEMEIASFGEGNVTVVVSGAFAFEGDGIAEFDPATVGVDTGNVTINGGGTPPGDAGELQAFTVQVSVASC